MNFRTGSEFTYKSTRDNPVSKENKKQQITISQFLVTYLFFLCSFTFSFPLRYRANF